MEWLQSFVHSPNHPLGLWILFLSAGIEYVFPPFPGDTVTLGGAVLIGKWRWSFWWVLGAVTAGSTLGAAVDYLLGVKLERWRRRKDTAADQAMRRILGGFRRWGIWLIAANRFFPGIRAFFFVAAGAAGFSFWPVVGLAFVSACVWNLLIVLVGRAVGQNLDSIKEIVGTYQSIVWVMVGLGAAGCALWYLRRRTRS